MPRAKKDCQLCGSPFQPRSEARALPHDLCPSCRKVKAGTLEELPRPPLTVPTEVPAEETHNLLAPLRQVVFDLETWGLDRGWGVTMVGSFLIHGDGPAKQFTFDLTESSTWPTRRSDDRELVEKCVGILQQCDVAYAHNGERFDMRWLRTACLKYGMSMPAIKLIDPAAIAWKKYRLGRNSLGAVANFLALGEQKMPVSEEVWRRALLDDSKDDWATLRARCESDVRLLNAIASAVTRDVGMIDYQGSAFR